MLLGAIGIDCGHAMGILFLGVFLEPVNSCNIYIHINRDFDNAWII